MYVLEFELEGLPKTTNAMSRATWPVRSKHNKRWITNVWAKCWHLRPEAPLYKAKLTLTRYSSSACDFDGLVSSFKPIIDGLRRAGVLIDDKIENTGIPEYKWEKAKKREGRIKVRVEEIANAV